MWKAAPHSPLPPSPPPLPSPSPPPPPAPCPMRPVTSAPCSSSSAKPISPKAPVYVGPCNWAASTCCHCEATPGIGVIFSLRSAQGQGLSGSMYALSSLCCGALPRLALASASRIEAVLQGSTMSGLPMVGVCAAPVLAHAQAPSSPPPRRACTEVGRSDEMIHSPYTPSSRSTPPPPAAARHTRGGVTWTAWF